MPTNWLHKILHHQVTPPKGVWEHIINQLEKEEEHTVKDLKTKMHAFEDFPPKTVLENIFNVLDKGSELVSLKERMYNFQPDAPPASWQNIINVLDKNETTTAFIKDNKQKIIFFRMVAAASVIAIFSTIIFLVKSNKASEVNDLTAAVNPSFKQQKKLDVEAEKATLPTFASREKKLSPNKSALPKVQNANPYNREEVLAADYIKSNKAEDLAMNPATEEFEKLQTTTYKTPMEIALMKTPNTYINIAGPDGQPLKVSAKFSNVINFLTDSSPEAEENIGMIIKESAKWKATFAKWREKMTNNVVAPSLLNFMDIVELSELMEEKK